jgi:ADP-ribosyl-[dinitrogen reductase] hydrolase
MHTHTEIRDRFRGCLIGLAVGDCLGAPIEFSPRGTYEPVTGLRPGGVFNLNIGEWTDDTSMALCMAESILQRHGRIDPVHLLSTWSAWYRHGYLSSTGRCFDIGQGTRMALERFRAQPQPVCGDSHGAGNGCLMRLAPVPMRHVTSGPMILMDAARISAMTTHGAKEAIDATMAFSLIISDAIRGTLDRSTLVPSTCPLDHPVWAGMHPGVMSIMSGSWRASDMSTVSSSGYVLDTLHAALWAFGTSNSFEEGALKAVNLGDDADTVGAVYGQLAGAWYGYRSIPPSWKQPLVMHDAIIGYADRLHRLAYPSHDG